MPTLQILVAVRFFASGSFLQVIGDTIGSSEILGFKGSKGCITCTSKKTEGIHLVAISRNTGSEARLLQQGRVSWVIGSLQGTHVRIQAPSANESDNVNRKGFHSISVQAMCKYAIIKVGTQSVINDCCSYLDLFKNQKPGIFQHCGKISRESRKAIHLKKIIYSCCKHFQESGIAGKVSVSIEGVHPLHQKLLFSFYYTFGIMIVIILRNT